MKAQIKIFESIAVLVIFIILVSIGLRFYTNVQMNSIRQAEIKFSRLDAVKTSIILSNLPELTCSFEGVADSACTDLYKVKAWSELSSDIEFIDFYYSQLGTSKIMIEKIYPSKSLNIIYNNTIEQASSDAVIVPTVLHNPITKENELGLIQIRSYYE